MKHKKLFVAGVAVVVLSIGIILITNGLADRKNVALDGIDLSDFADGSYVGAYDRGRWANTLAVNVENGKITKIDIVKNVLASGITNCSDEVFRRVIEKQSTQVDVVSRATVTSKAYLKAIENAISNAAK